MYIARVVRLRALAAAIPKVYWALAALVLVLGVVSPRSVEPLHLLVLASQGAALGFVAIGQTFVLISGGFDLSVASTVLLIDVVAAEVINGHAERILPATLLILLIGAAIGLLNGLLVTRLRVTPFIATLGTNLIVLGAALIYSGGAPGGSIPSEMYFWGNGFIAETLPASVALWLVAVLIAAFILNRTVLGRLLVGVGANPRAAHVAGIHVDRVKVAAYTMCGVMAAAGGWLFLAYVGTPTLVIGTDFLLGSVAASVIGGTLLTGGRGSMSGTAGGVLFLMVLYSILTVLDIPDSGRQILNGSAVLIAVAAAGRLARK